MGSQGFNGAWVGPGALPPGPRLPAWIQTALWFRWPVEFMNRCAREYGDIFTLRPSFLPPIVMGSEPRMVERVLTLGA